MFTNKFTKGQIIYKAFSIAVNADADVNTDTDASATDHCNNR